MNLFTLGFRPKPQTLWRVGLPWLDQFTTDTLTASPASVPSLLVAQILPGDVVWIPTGYYFLEKAINGEGKNPKP